jgi:transcription elongation factor GreA
MTDTVHYLTAEGYAELERKLEYLRNERRQEIAERLRVVMSEGGELSENAEYEDAKNDQAFVEGEIQRLEQILGSAEIIEDDAPKDSVSLGNRVTLREKGVEETEVYHLVGPAEANPKTGKISYKSPLGQSLLGQQVGDRVVVKAPDGDIVFEVLGIE